MRIMITAAGGSLAPLNIRFLKESKRYSNWVLAVDQRPSAIGRHFADAFAVVPGGKRDDYVNKILTLVKIHDIELILPCSDEEALTLAEARSEVERNGCILACADAKKLKIMTNKVDTYKLLSEKGISVPKFSLSNSYVDLFDMTNHYREKREGFAIKPPVSRGNRGVVVVHPHAPSESAIGREFHTSIDRFFTEVLKNIEIDFPVMVMELLKAPAYDIDIIARRGRAVNAVVRERINPAGVPFEGSIIRANPNLIDIASRITDAFDLEWLYDYDLMTDLHGQPVVLEVNPRPSGSIAASIAAGIPLYDYLVGLARGDDVQSFDVPDGEVVIPMVDCVRFGRHKYV